MNGHRWSAAVVAMALVMTAAAASAQMRRGGNETAEQNVRESQAYERLLCTNASFRAKRVQQECGPITDPQLRQSCEASFECGRGAAAPNWRKAPPSETIR